MKILLFGKNGQLGWELARALLPLGELIVLDRQGTSPWCGDLANLEGIRQTIQQIAPDIVVNATAYTAVDKAENEQKLAMLINAEALAVIAQEVQKLSAWLVHYSSDYVFDGSGSMPWQETDSVAPLNFYGKSKLAGEQAIQNSGCQYLIFRTSWVYATHGNNFIKTMLRLARERQQIKVVNDQIGAPMGAALLADLTAHVLRPAMHSAQRSGIYHAAPTGEVSWYQYALFVINYARSLGAPLQVQKIVPITSADFPTPAPRPLNSRLNCTKLTDTFSLYLPPWEVGVTRMIKEFLGLSS